MFGYEDRRTEQERKRDRDYLDKKKADEQLAFGFMKRDSETSGCCLYALLRTASLLVNTTNACIQPVATVDSPLQKTPIATRLQYIVQDFPMRIMSQSEVDAMFAHIDELPPDTAESLLAAMQTTFDVIEKNTGIQLFKRRESSTISDLIAAKDAVKQAMSERGLVWLIDASSGSGMSHLGLAGWFSAVDEMASEIS